MITYLSKVIRQHDSLAEAIPPGLEQRNKPTPCQLGLPNMATHVIRVSDDILGALMCVPPPP